MSDAITRGTLSPQAAIICAMLTKAAQFSNCGGASITIWVESSS